MSDTDWAELADRLQQAEAEVRRLKEVEITLRESEARHRDLIEHSLQGIVIHQDGIIRFGNQPLARMFGYDSPAQLIGKELWTTLVDPSEWPVLHARTAACLRGEPLPVHPGWRGIRRDGSPIWVEASATRTTWEGRLAILAFFIDITERRRAEEALRASEEHYRKLFETLPYPTWVYELETLRFLAVNDAAVRRYGWSREEFLRMDIKQIRPADQVPLLLEFLARRPASHDETHLWKHRTKDGTLLDVEITSHELLFNGRPARLVVANDVTERKRLEEQLRQSQKMEAIGQLAGGIAHDFNNLLTGILGNLALAMGDIPPGHPCRTLLNNVESAGLRAAELTQQLLGFSRRTPLRPVALDLRASIDETVRLLRHVIDPRITVHTISAPQLWPVQADASQIVQVLMNLCLNARDAMPQGGELTLETANVVLGPDSLRLHPDGRPGDFVRLRVSDTGTGIPPEVRAHLFEPFFTTKEPGKGTGLGLAMVFGIVQQHRGWIECHSTVGWGTRFDIYLPRLVTAVDSGAGPSRAEGVHGGRETILLVEDEEIVRRLGQAILERHGYQVLLASNGAEALEVYRNRHTEIDLVILDMAMPKLSGPDTLREMRRFNPTARVLISSGYCSDEDLRGVKREGAIGFVAKPYRPTDLARSVRAALDPVADPSLHPDGMPGTQTSPV
jgi:PAS domain S-box-containing protein